MTETTMPAAEGAVETSHDDERSSYEFSFHVLPTVAEGEVANVFETLKGIITKNSGELFDEESPERFDLAYEIIKPIEGKNRKFTSAYFGWVRFKSQSEAIAVITEEIEAQSDLLRYLLIKLTKVEEEHSFLFHEALADEKMVTTVEESSVVPDTTTVTPDSEKSEKKTEDESEEGEVDEKALEKALDKKEV